MTMPGTGFHYRNGLLHADDVPLDRLGTQHGTPLYIYSASMIRDRIAALRGALGNDVLIAYAAKANTNGAILALMAKAGLGADVVSGGELHRALRAGIPAAKIVFSGVGKTDDELVSAMRHGIARINVESESELERIMALAPATLPAGQRVRVALRFNPEIDGDITHAKISTGHGDSKFGLTGSDIRRLYGMAAGHTHVDVSGVSMHIGSQLTALEPIRDAFERLAALVTTLNAIRPVDSIDFGGGLGIRYTDEPLVDLAGYGALVRDILAPLGAAQLIAEPGRFLVGNAGILLGRVVHVKSGPGRPILILDTGMNDLMRPALYDAIHTLCPVAPPQGANTRIDIAGPVCESSDVFLKDVSLPALARGDLVALMNAGAYGFSMAGNYNSRLLPAEILVDGHDSHVIRDRQSLDDLIRGERTEGGEAA